MTVPLRFVLFRRGQRRIILPSLSSVGVGLVPFSPVRPWSLSQWYSPLWSVWRSLPVET
jgi:hypothetical protein